MINDDHGTFEFGGRTWQYRWISDNGLRVMERDPDKVVDGICAANWPTDGFVSVLVGRRVHFLDARENATGLEAIYCIA